MAFKINSRLAQAKLSRKQMLYDMPSYPESMGEAEQRENLVRYKKYLDSELVKFPKKSIERSMIGGLISQVNLKINKLRPKWHGSQRVNSTFIEAARKLLSHYEFKRVMDLASKMAKEEEEELTKEHVASE